MNDSVECSLTAGVRERLRIRAGDFSGTTAGLAPGNVQANLVILPKELAHISCGSNVPMYRTNIRCASAGPFAGSLVVSMRPLKPKDAIRAIQITSRFPSVHGAPVHIGIPGAIGIRDLATPDYGDAVPVEKDELPVFWACGVTPQAVIAEVRPDFCVTHAPGCMLITDLRNTVLASL